MPVKLRRKREACAAWIQAVEHEVLLVLAVVLDEQVGITLLDQPLQSGRSRYIGGNRRFRRRFLFSFRLTRRKFPGRSRLRPRGLAALGRGFQSAQEFHLRKASAGWESAAVKRY